MKKLLTFILAVAAGPIMHAQNVVQFKGGKNKIGFKDANGKVVVPCKFDEVSKFNRDGLAIGYINGATLDDTKTIVINSRGKEIISSKYLVVQLSEGSKYIQAGLGEKTGIMDTAGKIIVPFEFGNAKMLTDDLVEIFQDKKYGIINRSQWSTDKNSKRISYTIVIPAIYDQIYPLDPKYPVFIVIKDKKFGLFSTSGMQLRSCDYDYIRDFHNGVAEISMNNHKFFIDISGKEVPNK